MDPLVMKYIAVGLLVGVAGFFTWYEKLDKGVFQAIIMATLASLGVSAVQ